MWIITRDGFYSAVWDENCKADELMIRTHNKDDLCRLVKKLSGWCDESQIISDEQADYRFRIKISKTLWSSYVADCALQIDYKDVKKQLIPDGSAMRQNAYYEVWEALYRWQSKMIQTHDDSDPHNP
jgi:hypothetical protein